MKKLKSNQFSYSIHGSSKEFKEYKEQLTTYATELGKLTDKQERREFKNNVPSQKGSRFTLSSVIDKVSGVGHIGLAVCSESDNFSKKKGRDISIDRAIIYTNNDGEIKSGSPISIIEIKDIGLKNEVDIRLEVYKHLSAIRDTVNNNILDYIHSK